MPERALTIAGFDPSAGAGVLLDSFAFATLGYAPSACVASLTAQSSDSFRAAYPVDPEVLLQQISAIADDTKPACLKVGVVGSARNAEVVAECITDPKLLGGVPMVLDPVVASTSGGVLAEDIAAMMDVLAPLAVLVTPNAAEASALCDIDVGDVRSAERAARMLAQRWGAAVVVTGIKAAGSDGGQVAEVLVSETSCEVLGHELVEGVGDVRGTGCLFSSACACSLGCNRDVTAAVSTAQGFVVDTVERAVRLGCGRQQVDLAVLVGAEGR